ncbi:MAG: hypothetical protein CHACPFDD_04061 [Phycisphaerae bacterium]|nr:hypothetical protein [Phycisphaerae bacterium]
MANAAPTKPEPEQERKRHRSPNYPIVAIGTAIERATKLYETNKSHPTPLAVACKLWEYKVGSSVADQNIAALRAYGLVTVTGQGDKRLIAVSDDARRIILNAPERAKIVKRLALNPAIYKELWGQYGASMPNDETIKHYLLFREAGAFNDDVVDMVIDRFKQTIQFAKLTESDIIEEKETDAEPPTHGNFAVRPSEQPKLERPKPPMAGTNQDVFTLQEGPVVLQWPATLTPAGYEDLKDWFELVLRKIKRSIAQRESQDSSPAE